jgi:hypothetical protein
LIDVLVKIIGGILATTFVIENRKTNKSMAGNLIVLFILLFF